METGELSWPLTDAQEEIFYAQALSIDSSAYNTAQYLEVSGPIDIAAFIYSTQRALFETESLWLHVAEIGDTPTQVFKRPLNLEDIEVQYFDFSDEENATALAMEYMNSDIGSAVDIMRGGLINQILFRLRPDEFWYYQRAHHLILDGSGHASITNRVAHLYNAKMSNMLGGISNGSGSVVELLNEQLEVRNSERYSEHRTYWRNQFRTVPDRVDLAGTSSEVSSGFLREIIEIQDMRVVTNAARRCGVSWLEVLIAAWNGYLNRMTGATDLVTGIPIAPELGSAAHRIPGMSVKVLPLRVNLDPYGSAAQLVATVAERLREASRHRLYGAEQLYRELRAEGGQQLRLHGSQINFVPFFQAPNISGRSTRVRNLSAGPVNDVSILVFDAAPNEPVQLYFDANPSLFNSSELRSHARRFARFATQFSEAVDKNSSFSSIEMLSDNASSRILKTAYGTPRNTGTRPVIDMIEHQVAVSPQSPVTEGAGVAWLEAAGEILDIWSGASKWTHTDTTIVRLFEEQASAHPTSTAVVFKDVRLSYSELDSRSNRLARKLISEGVGPDTLVAVVLPRSADLIVALLGVLKAGGGYVPVDPTYPATRIDYVLADSAPAAAISWSRCETALPGGVPVVDLDAVDLTGYDDAAVEDSERTAVLRPDSVAYVIYTSGSTGQPKGVMIPHSNVAQLMANTHAQFGFDDSDVWTLFHSIAFDFSVWELWGALLHGGTLVVVDYLTSRSPEQFLELLTTERVTVLNQTPSAFYQLTEADRDACDAGSSVGPLSLRYVIFGGEALELRRLSSWFDRHGDTVPRLVNMYGITETTVHVTYIEIGAAMAAAAEVSVVGRPIPGLRVYLLDDRLHPVSVGVSGELYVAGDQVARGYLKRPALSTTRFVANPFGASGSSIYRSGDIARWSADGALEFVGRVDDQVKVRGFRIELAEVAAAVLAHPKIGQAAAAVHRDALGDKRLVAYFVPRSGSTLDQSELRDWVSDMVPDYMVPSAFVVLDAIPLTTNGKLDRRALPKPMSGAHNVRSALNTPPRTSDESAVAKIWMTTLDTDKIGIDERINDLGVDSISGTKLAGAMRRAGYVVTLRDLVEKQTIRGLFDAEVVDVGNDSEIFHPAPFDLIKPADRALVPYGVDDAYPATQLQLGMIYHSDLEPERAAFHDVFSYRIALTFVQPVLESLIVDATKRHEVLRTSFALSTYSRPMQIVQSDVTPLLSVYSLRHLDDPEQRAALSLWFESEKTNPFVWAIAPLIRFAVHQTGSEEFVLSVSLHHSIIDGWSYTTLLAGLIDGYQRSLQGLQPMSVPDRRVPYNTYVAIEIAAQDDSAAADYWRRELGSSLPGAPFSALATPCRRYITPRWSQDSLAVDEAHYLALRQKAREYGVPIRNLCIAVHLRALSIVSGRVSVTSGIFSHGRPEIPDADRMVGLFLNILPLRIKVENSWKETLRCVSDSIHRSMAYRYYSYASIQSATGSARLAHTAFNFVHFREFENRLGNIGNETITESKIFEHTDFSLLTTFVVEPFSNDMTVIFNADGEALDSASLKTIVDVYRFVIDDVLTTNDSFDVIESFHPSVSEDQRNRPDASFVCSRALDILRHFYWKATGSPASELSLLDYQPDSISAVQISHRLNRELGIDVPLKMFTEPDAIHQLLIHVAQFHEISPPSAISRREFRP